MEATATTEEKVDGSKDRVGDAVQRHQGTNNGRATLSLRIGELHGDLATLLSLLSSYIINIIIVIIIIIIIIIIILNFVMTETNGGRIGRVLVPKIRRMT